MAQGKWLRSQRHEASDRNHKVKYRHQHPQIRLFYDKYSPNCAYTVCCPRVSSDYPVHLGSVAAVTIKLVPRQIVAIPQGTLFSNERPPFREVDVDTTK